MAVYDLEQLLANNHKSLPTQVVALWAKNLKEISIFVWRVRVGLFVICTVGIFILFLCFQSGAWELWALFLPALFGLFIWVLGRKKNLEKVAAQMCDFLVCHAGHQAGAPGTFTGCPGACRGTGRCALCLDIAAASVSSQLQQPGPVRIFPVLCDGWRLLVICGADSDP